MNRVNYYDIPLSAEEIARQEHRGVIGGRWEELGLLQLEFMKSHGLRPEHRFADVGCGALRGGIKYLAYLNPGNYYGLDLNLSLIDAGRMELAALNLQDRGANLLVSDKFELHKFKTTFHFGIAQSVFSHLPMNHILRCLKEVKRVLEPGGIFYASFLRAPGDIHLESVLQGNNIIYSQWDVDPYHYSINEMEWMGHHAELDVNYIGDWNHPAQMMMGFIQR